MKNSLFLASKKGRHLHTSSDFTFLLQLLPATLLPENVKLLGQLWRVPQQVCRQHPASPAWLLCGPGWSFVWGSPLRLWTETSWTWMLRGPQQSLLECEQNLRWALFSQFVDVIYPSGSIITLVIAVFERNLPGIEPGPLGWYTSAITTRLQEVRQ